MGTLSPFEAAQLAAGIYYITEPQTKRKSRLVDAFYKKDFFSKSDVKNQHSRRK